MVAFERPNPFPSRNFQGEYDGLLRNVNAVNHGEFERAVDSLLEQAATVDQGENRAAALAIQRCRRGGKTFMLHAVASMLQKDSRVTDSGMIVLFVSLNSLSAYNLDEDAYTAILSRIAWELSGREPRFRLFAQKYDDFGAVDEWLTNPENQVLLLVDELNVIPHAAGRYTDLSSLLDVFIQQEGCALLYSTHQRETADLLRGRTPTNYSLTLSKRPHLWLPIPRITGEGCLRGMLQSPNEQLSFWSAVLRGRLPALLVLKPEFIPSYAEDIYTDVNDTAMVKEERKRCLAAVITGDIGDIPNGRGLFRAYSYMSERFTSKLSSKPRFAWPPFMVAQAAVLGKAYSLLRTTLESPCVDEAKAFEAMTQLAVLVRLVSEKEHALVPHNPSISDSLEETEMFHIAAEAKTLAAVVEQVSIRFHNTNVLQVVAVPLFASFPTYDFFLLHFDKEGGTWNVAAGYQCKMGTENPSEDAWQEVPLSVWLEGKCRRYRVEADGRQVAAKKHRGWFMMGESKQADMLGVSVAEALPQDSAPGLGTSSSVVCRAETLWNSQKESAMERFAKKRKTEDV